MTSIPRRSLRWVAILGVAIAVLCSWIPSIQDAADAQVDAGLKRSLATFAIARTLNGLISTVQGTEVSMQPLGVGVTLTVGQVLDPLNDLVEQFSSLMLAVSIAFGVQKILLKIGAHWMISVMVTAIAVLWAVRYLRDQVPAWLARALLVVIVVRFALPAITIGSEAVFTTFLANGYEQAQQTLGAAASQAEKAGSSDGTILERLRDLSPTKAVGKVAALGRAISEATQHIINLAAVFLVQTIVVPLALLWALMKLVGAGFRMPGMRGRPSTAA
jgi:hypothetical protein